MDKSQLRRLALDFADGDIPAREYRQRRRELIDGIVGGTTQIQREPRPAVIPRDLVTGRISLPPPAQPARPWARIAGGAAAAGAAILAVLLLWPGDEAPPPAPIAPSVPDVGLSPARALIESFVARRNFTVEAVSAFERQWTELTQDDRDEALGSPWFSSLTRALRDELKTQNALAGLAGGEAARRRARQIAELGERMGIAAQLPGVDQAAIPDTAADSGTGSAVTVPAPGSDDRAAAPASPAAPGMPGTPGKGPAAAPSAPGVATLTGREWLALHNDTDLTLQLFAVNGLDRVEQLMAAHPDLNVRILATDGAAPRYRVFHGVFSDEAAARSAFDALPGDLTGAAGGAIVKSFATVRDDLAGQETQALAAPPRAHAGAEDGRYTLQLFASGNRDNARALVRAFPALPLQLRELNGDAAPFRVVYGRFDSEDSARAASGGLPAALLAKIGQPLAKPMADTGTAVSP